MKKHKILTASALFGAGIVYYLMYRYTGFGIPCVFYELFHVRCPGCGITHMIVELSFFHWKEAMEANYFLFFTSPVLAGLCLYEWFRAGRQHAKASAAAAGIALGYLVLALFWMLVRNMLHI